MVKVKYSTFVTKISQKDTITVTTLFNEKYPLMTPEAKLTYKDNYCIFASYKNAIATLKRDNIKYFEGKVIY